MGRRPSMQQIGRHCREYSTIKKKMPLQRFFKIILPSIIDDKRLSLPPEFVRKYGNEFSDVAKLNVSSRGRVWKVGLTKGRDNHWCFDQGWHEFVTYHAIELGYFLVFKYKGMSNFKVLMFGKSACEIPYSWDDDPPSNDKNQCSLHQSDDGMEDYDDCAETLGCKFNSYPSTSKGLSRKLGASSRKQHLPSPVNASSADKRELQQEYQKKSRTCKMEEEDQMLKNETLKNVKSEAEFECEKSGRETEICISIKLNNTLSRMPLECKRAVERAFELKPQNPSFLVLVSRHHLRDGFMMVPSSFATRYMPAVSETIRVESGRDGRQWLVKSCWNRRGGNLIIRRGWKDFFQDNNLVEGDVCLFEMIKMKNITLKASIVRANWK